MSNIQHISTVQIGGDVNWWSYGGIFTREFEQNGVTYRELWKVDGLEDEYADMGLEKICRKKAALLYYESGGLTDEEREQYGDETNDEYEERVKDLVEEKIQSLAYQIEEGEIGDLAVTVYRCSLATDPEDDIFEICNTYRKPFDELMNEFYLELFDNEPKFNNIEEKRVAELNLICHYDLSWANLKSVISQYEGGVEKVAKWGYAALVAEVYNYHGWINGDNYPEKMTKKEICNILKRVE